MKLTPFDIRKHEFAKTFRGCDPAEVNMFLEQVAAEIDEEAKQNMELTQKMIGLEAQLTSYTSVEKAMQQTFMQAQETSGKAIEHSRKEAQLIIQEAEMKASQIVDKARNELIGLKEQVTILKAKKDSIVTRLKMLLNSELDLLKALEVDEGPQSPGGNDLAQEQSRTQLEIEDILKSLDAQ